MQVLWPDFSIWHMYAGVLYYQQHYNDVQVSITNIDVVFRLQYKTLGLGCLSTKLLLFWWYNANLHLQTAKEEQHMEEERLRFQSDREGVLEDMRLEKEPDKCSDTQSTFQQRLCQYTQDREKRVAKFLEHVAANRKTFFTNIQTQTLAT